MKIFSSKLFFISFLATVIFHLNGCLKGEFDTPPAISEPQISAENIVTMQAVLDKLVPGKVVKLDMDKYVKAVVIADDKSGNFYKTIHVKDENSAYGIGISIEETEIHAHYPVGRRVFIHLKDLYIGDNNGLPLLNFGTYTDNGSIRTAGIPGSLLQKVLLKGATGVEVVPVKVNINQLGNAALNTLIQLDEVEFRDANQNTTYAIADPLNPQTINHIITDCAQNQITLRNSGYADFAGKKVPLKNGTLIGIYTIFGNTKQIFIRDTTDVQFSQVRCGEREGERVSIRSIRDAYENGVNTLTPGTYLRGVVISDYTQNNLDSRNVVIQDGDAGMVCRFSSAPNIEKGTEVRVNLTGMSLSEFRGLVQVSNLPNSNLVILGQGTLPEPKVLKINQISTSQHESTLIKIEDAEFTGGTTYGATGVSIKDNTGTIQVFTRTQSTFGSQAVKTGKVKVTAIVGKYDNIQLQLRGTYDVE